jgi:quaternary ammonium compound-resistance protein SugE
MLKSLETYLSTTAAAWTALILAGIFEIGWPLGLKMAQTGPHRLLGVALGVGAMLVSGLCLWFAQKAIPMGTAYAVWTGIGAAGTFCLGLLLYGEPASLMRVFGAGLIVLGVIALKAGH